MVVQSCFLTHQIQGGIHRVINREPHHHSGSPWSCSWPGPMASREGSQLLTASRTLTQGPYSGSRAAVPSTLFKPVPRLLLASGTKHPARLLLQLFHLSWNRALAAVMEARCPPALIANRWLSIWKRMQPSTPTCSMAQRKQNETAGPACPRWASSETSM